MAVVSELDAMKLIDDSLSGISDPPTRDRILKWAWAKFASSPSIPMAEAESVLCPEKVEKGAHKKVAKGPVKGKVTHAMVKTLNLKPNGKKSFNEFVEEKKPSSNLEKCVIAVHYVANVLNESPVSADHVYTCYKIQGWRIPSDLDNTLAYTASQKAWIDTSNMSDIKLTTHGDNLVEHDLPKKTVGA